MSVREALAEGWRLLRSQLGSLVAIAVVPEVLRNLLLLPLWFLYGNLFASELRFFAELDWSRYRTDPLGVQRELEAIFRVPGDQALAVTVGGGLSAIVGLIGFAAITAGTLAAADGRRPSVSGAWRSVAAHPGSLIVAPVILGLASMVLLLPVTLGQGMMMAGGGSSSGALLSSLASLLAFIVLIAIFVLIVRWAVVYQVVLHDGLGLVAALRRSAQLTAGVRTRVGLALLAFGFTVGIVGSLFAFVVALVGWLLTSSVDAAVVAYAIGLAITGLIYLPWAAALLTHVYRLRVSPAAPLA